LARVRQRRPSRRPTLTDQQICKPLAGGSIPSPGTRKAAPGQLVRHRRSRAAAPGFFSGRSIISFFVDSEFAGCSDRSRQRKIEILIFTDYKGPQNVVGGHRRTYTGGFGTMGTFRRSATIISFITLALSSPGHAVCGPGNENCEPSQDDVRVKVEQLFNSAFLTPYSIVSLEKFDGHGVETQGRKIYEMRFFAVLNYSGDKLRCQKKLCPELHNYLVEIDEAAKKATIAGWLFFEQTEQTWR